MPSKTENESLRPHQKELKQLGELAGIYMDSEVFISVLVLLNMGINAETIYNLLKTLRRSNTRKSRSSLSTKSSKARTSV